MASAPILVTVLLGVGAAVSGRTWLRSAALVFLACVGGLYGISRWLVATAPRVQGCAYLCSPREDAGVWLLFAAVGLLVVGTILLAAAALLLSLIRRSRRRRP